jgi:YD repeat-containing protein
MASSNAATSIVLILIAILVGLWPFEANSAESCPATNECVGPEVGQYSYTIANGGGVIMSGAQEAETIAAYTQLVTDTYQPCTFDFSDDLPPPLPIQEGHGNAVSGPVADYYAAMAGNGTYGNIVWNLSTEVAALRIPLVYSGTYGSGCSRTFRFGAYLQRSREVRCPGFGGPGGYKIGGGSAFCWRARAARNPMKNLGERSTICANPVNAATGSKFQAETDYRSPNGSGELSFTRYYDSRFTEFYSTGSPYGVKSSLGPNWRSTYEQRIDFSASLLFPTAHVYRPDGQTLFFHFVDDQFVPDADVADRLVRLNDSSGNLLNWQYTVAGTEDVETYDASGKLISIRTRAGVMQTLGYNASDGKLESVEDSFGKRLEFAYDSSGRLASVTTPGGGTFTYAYNAQNNVSSITYPDGRSRTYLYNEQQNTGSRNYPWALTGIVDEANSRFSTYKYDGNRRAYSSEHAGGANKYVFTYPGTFEIGQVTITDPLLQNRTVTFKTIHGMAKISAISQPCATCGGSASATSYDANGNASSRADFNGNVTTYAYDLTRNLESLRTEAFDTLRARTITTQWHPTYRLPTQIDEPGKRTTFTHDANGNVLTRTE